MGFHTVSEAYLIRPTNWGKPRVARCDIKKIDFLWGFHGVSMGSMGLNSRFSDFFLRLLNMTYRLQKTATRKVQ